VLTIAATGTGTVTLSNAATGTLNASSARPSLTVTATTTTLTCTVSGTVTEAQVNRGAAALAYVPTAGAARYAPPVEHDGTAWGVRGEPAATNRVLWCRDLSNAAWTKTNATATLTATGIDGAANSASVVTATDANATVLQAITHTSTARTLSVFLRRRTGTGTVETTINGGTDWVARTLTSAWQRFQTSATLADPSVGVRIVTSGDAVDVDFVQPEDGAVATSPIPTFGAAVTRTADTAVVPYVAPGEATIVAEFVPRADAPVSPAPFQYIFGLDDGTLLNLVTGFRVFSSSATRVRFAAVAGGVSLPSADAEPIGAVTGAVSRAAFAWNATALAVSLSGDALVRQQNLSAPPAPMNRLVIGNRSAGDRALNGTVRTLRLIRRRLPNSQLQALTL